MDAMQGNSGDLGNSGQPRLLTRKLTPVIGAEIAGVDLSRPFYEALKQELYEALLEHLLMFA
jgi:hypothetical protein